MKKQILTDERGRPLAVQIAYGDWLAIEQVLAGRLPESSPPAVDVMRFAGLIHSGEPPLEFQHRMRGEWQ
jgi:hypothetical protein